MPGDVSVIGYDDLPVSRLLSPPLTGYRWPVQELVTTVVSWAVEAAEQAASPDAELSAHRAVLTPTPMPRASVAPPPQR